MIMEVLHWVVVVRWMTPDVVASAAVWSFVIEALMILLFVDEKWKETTDVAFVDWKLLVVVVEIVEWQFLPRMEPSLHCYRREHLK